MDPINYSIGDVASPSQAFLGGLQGGAAIQDIQLKQQQQQLALQQAAQLRTDLAEYQKNPTVKGISSLSMKYPQLSEQFKRSYDMLAPQEQAAKLESAVPVYAAVLNGKPDTAIELLEQSATALKNSGDEKGAGQAKTIAQLIKDHPENAKATMGLLLSSAMGPDKFTAAFGALGDESRKAETAPVDLAKAKAERDIKQIELASLPADKRSALLKSQAETAKLNADVKNDARRLALDENRLLTETQLKVQENAQKYGELPQHVLENVNSAINESVTAKQSSENLLNLADEFAKHKDEFNTGLFGKGQEAWKKVYGSTNELTRIRSNYRQIVTQEAMAAYKKVASGSTSDKDIETAMEGYPKDTDEPAIIESKLRGMAKMQQYNSVLANAKSDWLGANRGNLGKSKVDINVDGVDIPAGTTFKDFSDQFVNRKVEALAAEQKTASDLKKLQGKSYLKYGNTGASGTY